MSVAPLTSSTELNAVVPPIFLRWTTSQPTPWSSRPNNYGRWTMRILNIVETAYRATLEEQDDTILWLSSALKNAGAEVDVLLRGNAVNYLVLQECPSLKIGGLGVNHPARPNDDIGRLREKGVKIFVMAADLKERGIAESRCMNGAKMIRNDDLSKLMEGYHQI